MKRMDRIWRITLSSGKSEWSIDIDGTPISLQVRRYARSRGYRLRYDSRSGALRLSIPMRGSEKNAVLWAQEQAAWVRGQIAKTEQPRILMPGMTVLFEGVNHEIMWDQSFPRAPHISDGKLYVGGPEASVGSRILRWLRQRALSILTDETHEFAAKEGLKVVSVRIGDPRSRWGSCSCNGEIRYSWRLILAPPDVRRATVAHEVAHLLHMDHSPAFHAAHARLLEEDPAPARAWLRRHAASLHAVTV